MIESIKTELESEFPEYEFSVGKRIYGKCLIVKKSKYCGADIFIKNDKMIIEPAIPEMKTRLLIGGGAALLKMFKKDYSEPADRIFEYLKMKNKKIEYRK
ncbi:MAG: hypothetical protein R2785_01260 [Flavobacteriaceae bacterium]